MDPPVRPLTAFVLCLACLPACRPRAAPESRDRPVQVTGNGYVGSQACRACHPGEYASWRASYHSTMTQLPTPDAVRADFGGVDLVRDRRAFHLERREGGFWVEEDGSGKGRERPIALVTGSHHFQVFWLPTGHSRKLALFDFCWNIAEARWIPMDDLPLAPPEVHQTLGRGDEGTWNVTCNRCHTTGSVPRIRSPAEMDNRVAEFGVACEACHGPGERHVTANRGPPRRYGLHLSGERDPTIVQPARLPAERALQVCGQCHSVNTFYDRSGEREWAEHGFPYRPGDDLEKTRKVIQYVEATPLYRVTKFWPDGEVRVNGREYNSLLRSPCSRGGGLTCTSCHELHRHEDDPRTLAEWADDQLGTGMRGNVACLQCHPRFEAEDALTAHTHHAAGSPGSRCYDCHMPHTAWGLHKATRDHQVTSPSVAASLASGRPDACSLCHLDRTLAWSAQQLQRWYGTPAPTLGPLQDVVAASVLWALTGDAGQRALVAWHMGWEPARAASGSDWLAPYLAQLLADPYAATRSVAYRSLRSLSGFEDFEYDPAASSEERAAASRRALELWQASGGSRRSHGRAILIDGRRRLQRGAFQSLAARRNDRPTYLAE